MIGKRLGRNKWSPSNQKTGEGTIAFAVSVTLSALILRSVGLTEEFSVSGFPSLVPNPCLLRFDSTLLMETIIGSQVHLRGRTFLAAGGILRAKR